MTTVLENIELCDKECVEAKAVNIAQKIKLRAPSYLQISSEYMKFIESNHIPSQESSTIKQETDGEKVPEMQVSVESNVEIVSVTAVNPRVALMLNLLEITGKGPIKSSAYKALKIKPVMRENMEKNTATVTDTLEADVEATNKSETLETVTELEPEIPVAETSEEKNTTVDLFENLRVSKNGATVAKVEKYVIDEQHTDDLEDEVSVSPTVVDEATARPVSRETPVIAVPRAVSEPKKEFVLTPKTETEKDEKTGIINVSTIDNINNLADLRAYLAETARIKEAAERAKTAEEEAKKNAELAEKEAENRRTEMLRTAEKVAAHQEALREQAEKSKEQASMYDAKRGQYETEKTEYQKAIDDMLALMNGTNQVDKEKSL